MELFKKRPLCFFCFLFIITAVLVRNVGYGAKQVIMAILLCLTMCTLGALFINRLRKGLLYLVLSLAFVFLSVLSSYARVDVPAREAEKYFGERRVEMTVTSREYTSPYTSTYKVRIDKLDGDTVKEKALLVMGFTTDYDVGDRIYADAELMDMGQSALGMSGYGRVRDAELNIMAVIYEPEGCAVRRFSRDASLLSILSSKDGVRVLASRAQTWIKERLNTRLGEVPGALASGFLIGDTSDISTEIIRDFRRSGVAHLLAVSGVHISVLLGAIDCLLRALLTPKKLRIIIISAFAVVLLFLSGFAMSAVRSVFMLWCVYLSFMAYEDNDTPTALFATTTVILLIFPYAVYELGLWMSFLATLGLVTVFPIIDRAVPRVPKGRKMLSLVAGIARSMLMSGAMTLVASVFLMIISAYVFGELSAVSVPVNMIVTPMGTVFLIVVALVLILGGVPLVGDALSVLSRFVGDAMIYVTSFFSGINGASLSLRYPFAGILVLALTAVVGVMLVIRVRRKWMFAIPPIGFTVAFAICVCVFNIYMPASLNYRGYSRSETLSVCDDGALCIVDLSSGYYSCFSNALYSAGPVGATDIDAVVLTRVNKTHVSSLERLFRAEIVHKLYIPMPIDKEEYERTLALASLAEKSGVRLYVYSSEDTLSVLSDVSVRAFFYGDDRLRGTAVLISGGENIVGYADAYCADKAALELCDTVIIGERSHGDEAHIINVGNEAVVVFSSEDIYRRSRVEGGAHSYAIKEDKKELKILLD